MEISNYNELVTEIEKNRDGDYILINDIVCPDTGQRPICSAGKPFTGTLDGGGYTIRNLNIDGSNDLHVGLFTYCNGASIMNLSVEGSITGGYCVGGIAACCENMHLKKCLVAVNITSNRTATAGIGGLVGEFTVSQTNGGSIDGCAHSGAVVASAVMSVGGLCGSCRLFGSSSAASITNSYHVGKCEGASYTGGIVGNMYVGSASMLNISRCYVLGSFKATPYTDGGLVYLGGLVGHGRSVTISDSLALCSAIDTTLTLPPYIHPIMPKIAGGKDSEIINSYAWRGMTLRTTLNGIVSGNSPTDADTVGWEELCEGERFYKEKLGWDFYNDWTMRSGDYPFPKIRYDNNTPMKGKVQPVSFKLEPRFIQGDGKTEETAYIIHMPEQFDMIRENLTAFYKVERDMDFTDFKSLYTSDGRFLPIGDAENPFNGSIEGIARDGAHKIVGLNMAYDDIADAGLFGCVGKNGKVTGLNVSGTVKGKSNTGMIAGYNLGSITGCCAGGIIEGGTAGGIAGTNFGTITDCFTAREGVACGTSSAGGIAGENCGVIERCYARGTVKSAQSLGGIAGIHYKLPDGGSIKNCVAAHRPEFLKNAGKTYYGSIAGEELSTVSNNYVLEDAAQSGDTKRTIEELTERSFWVGLGYMKEAVGESGLWKWDGDFPYL